MHKTHLITLCIWQFLGTIHGNAGVIPTWKFVIFFPQNLPIPFSWKDDVEPVPLVSEYLKLITDRLGHGKCYFSTPGTEIKSDLGPDINGTAEWMWCMGWVHKYTPLGWSPFSQDYQGIKDNFMLKRVRLDRNGNEYHAPIYWRSILGHFLGTVAKTIV